MAVEIGELAVTELLRDRRIGIKRFQINEKTRQMRDIGIWRNWGISEVFLIHGVLKGTDGNRREPLGHHFCTRALVGEYI